MRNWNLRDQSYRNVCWIFRNSWFLGGFSVSYSCFCLLSLCWLLYFHVIIKPISSLINTFNHLKILVVKVSWITSRVLDCIVRIKLYLKKNSTKFYEEDLNSRDDSRDDFAIKELQTVWKLATKLSNFGH